MNNNLAALKLTLANLSRDKVDALLLLLTCGLILYPFFSYSPIWLNLTATGLIAWRAWLSIAGRALPKTWQLTLVTAALSVGVYWHYRTWLGKDAGVAFLIVLVCLKMLEMHARRDAMAVIFACYFLLVGQLLYSQSLPSALYLLMCAGLLISTQMSFQYHLLVPKLSTRILNGYKILALAIPLALILFLFFPRFQGPLWGKQQGNATGITGLSDSMEPGNIAELALSDQIAFRVRFPTSSVPGPRYLYWRGVVLDIFDGKRWSASPSAKIAAPALAATHGVSQDIILEPNNQHWLFGLDRPISVIEYNGAQVSVDDRQYSYLTGYGEMRSPALIQDRIRYTIVSDLDDRVADPTHPAPARNEQIDILGRDLQLPSGANPLTIQWAQQLRSSGADPIRLANLVLQYFHVQPFRYTLDPPPLGANQIDDFMFTTQAGFCEHYASAFVVIMRAMHIPARVVTGYQGGEINPLDGLMTVRQSDAHAWAEIWIERRGWIRLDPTAAVAPNRVEHGMRGSFPDHNLSSLLNLGRQAWLSDLNRQMQQSWDAVNSAWNLWVLNYNLDKQKNLLSSLSGIEHPEAAQLGIAMMIAASLVAATLSLIMLGRRNNVAPLDRLYLNFCRHMRRQGYARMPAEGASDYSRRLQTAFPGRRELVDFLSLYSRCKYGRGYNAGQLAQLKKLLKLCLQLKSA